jgi:hypothetical protein
VIVPVTVTVTRTLRGTTSFATAFAEGVAPGNTRRAVTPFPESDADVKIEYAYEDDVDPLIATTILPAPAVMFATKTSFAALYVVRAIADCVVVAPAAINAPVIFARALSVVAPFHNSGNDRTGADDDDGARASAGAVAPIGVF